MPRSVSTAGAAASSPEVSEFFVGVEEMRAFLDRNLQDPEHQRRRLTRMARELVKPRSVADLCLWLAEETREAVGAEACTLALLDPGWRPWVISGASRRRPPEQLCLDLGRDFSPMAPPAPVALGDDLLVPLAGISRVPACLWLELEAPLEPPCVALLGALASTAGVRVEQELSAERMLREPVTGLWAENAFLGRVDLAERPGRAEDGSAVLVAARVVGLDAIRTVRGIRAAQETTRQLASAGREAWPDELLGVRFTNLLAFFSHVEGQELEGAIAERVRDLATRLRRRSAEASPLSLAAVYAAVRSGADLRWLVEHMCRQLESSAAGVFQLVERRERG